MLLLPLPLGTPQETWAGEDGDCESHVTHLMAPKSLYSQLDTRLPHGGIKRATHLIPARGAAGEARLFLGA